MNLIDVPNAEAARRLFTATTAPHREAALCRQARTEDERVAHLRDCVRIGQLAAPTISTAFATTRSGCGACAGRSTTLSVSVSRGAAPGLTLSFLEALVDPCG